MDSKEREKKLLQMGGSLVWVVEGLYISILHVKNVVTLVHFVWDTFYEFVMTNLK